MTVRLTRKLLFLMLLIPGNIWSQPGKDSYSSSSVLSSGQWLKIGVVRDAIYRIDFSKIVQSGLSNPSNPKIYANNFGQLSYYNNDPKPDDLKELAVMLVTGTDGLFNEGDYLLFYGQGPGRWKYNTEKGEYEFNRHNYSDTAFYFITSGGTPGKRIALAQQPEESPDYISSGSDALYIHEQESENLIKSGREWYQPLSAVTGITINPGFNDIATDQKFRFRIRVLARAPVNTLFRLYENTTIHKSIQAQAVNMQNYTGTYAQIADSSGTALPLSSSPVWEIRFFNNGESGARAWLDFITIQARKNNSFKGQSSFYSDQMSVASGRITEFKFISPGYSPLVWDITDPFTPEAIQYNKTADEISFKAATSSLKTFILFTENNAITPIFRNRSVPNQDLHASEAAEMVIVTHPLFRNQAVKLANLHFKNSGLVSQVVTPEEVYNEFSGGIPDIAAIRNFLRMKYLRQSGTMQPLKYLLLFGDGSYENITPPPGNPNFIPTYQSQNSTVVVSSFTSDDFFGLLEDGEGEAEGTEDLGIGRLPVADTTQAGIILRKIAAYLDPSNTGEWKNIICLTADDEDGNTHMYDAEGLASLLEDSVPSFNISKIYLDAFRQVTSVNGQSYPDAVIAINNRINSGCLIFNYTGHGSETGLAHERVVKTEDINAWKNGSKLPLFITATCEFSRFDDAVLNIITREITARTSAGEMVLLNEKGGGIALMSTTRIVYSAPNYFLNRNIYKYAFNRDSTGKALRLGDIIRLAKNSSGTGPNKRNFSLLGDPAVRLAFPWHGTVVTDSVNHVAVTEPFDTLKALTRVTVSGHIEDNKHQLMNNFNGNVSPVVFDKVSNIRTLANDGGPTMQFGMRNNIIFSGKTGASGGKFSFTFIVPREIDFTYGKGWISYYASDMEQDMTGFFSDITVGGFARTDIIDTTGPVIKLFMNDTLFRSGGITDADPQIFAIIEDDAGINTTGSGIGHDLTAWIDNDRSNSFVLNNYFENDAGSYTRGTIKYNLYSLREGSHTLTLKAWDNFNNSSEKTIIFLVETGDKFILRNLINYPNPFFEETMISAGHNQPYEEMVITVTIYDLSGRIIRILRNTSSSGGYQLPPISWDGKTEGGRKAGRGMYPYRVSVKTGKGETAVVSGKMIIL